VVKHNKPLRTLHFRDGLDLSFIQRKGFLQVLRSLDSLAHIVATYGITFNWGAIISKQLSTRIEEVQNTKPEKTHAFYMASYLLDEICTRSGFPVLILR
jgi:hypothetical protein